jgi:hypothetical protein
MGPTCRAGGGSRHRRRGNALYLNFDMVGSPDFVRFIYDRDGSAFDLAGPPGRRRCPAATGETPPPGELDMVTGKLPGGRPTAESGKVAARRRPSPPLPHRGGESHGSVIRGH